MEALLVPADLLVFDRTLESDKAQALITYVEAEARRVAPCLKTTTDPDILESAKGTLVRAALRWADQGSGAFQQWSNTDGPFTRSASVDNRTGTSHTIFYPSEEAALRELCLTTSTRRVKTGWLL